MAFVSSNDVGAVVAIIGATGAVGKDLIEALCGGDFPLKGLVLFTSLRSGNELTEVDGRRIRIHPTPDDLVEHPLCFLFEDSIGLLTIFRFVHVDSRYLRPHKGKRIDRCWVIIALNTLPFDVPAIDERKVF